MTDMNDLLRELQTQCLSDPDDLVEELKSSIDVLKENPAESVLQMQRTLHNLKGNMQTVGFSFFGNFAHEFETALESVHLCLLIGHQQIDEKIDQLINFLTIAADDVGKYFEDLRTGVDDCDVLFDLRSESLKAIVGWADSLPVSSASRNDENSNGVQEIVIDPKNKVLEETKVSVNSENIVDSNIELESGIKDLLCFIQGTQRYAVPISRVDEIIEYQSIQKFPFPNDNVLGLILHRGEPLSIVNTKFYGVPNAGETPSAIIVMKFDDYIFGFLVDKVDGIFSIDSNLLQKPDNMQSHGKNWVTALCREGENRVVIVDPGKSANRVTA